jgi:hypothetical protein
LQALTLSVVKKLIEPKDVISKGSVTEKMGVSLTQNVEVYNVKIMFEDKLYFPSVLNRKSIVKAWL